MNSKITLSILLSAGLFISSNAQNGTPGIDFRSCSTAEKNNKIIDNDPAVKAIMDQQNQEALDWTQKHYGESTVDATGKKTVLYVIPVVWHVIHNNGPENISKATIESEIAKLNEDYQKLNADAANAFPLFAPLVADVQVEFRLARLDPDGNCTEGITRRVNAITNAMDESAKTIEPSWNRNGRYYLNIWQGSSIASGAGGYAYYPGAVGMSSDGIVLIGGQLGNTVTHEVGHWLNLIHMWGNTNNPGPGQTPDNCTVDDLVLDTPNTLGQTGCSSTTTSCGSIDNVQNYMDYNFCDVMFTIGQSDRMHAALNSTTDVGKRKTMWSATNRTNTGTADPYVQTPVCTLIGADFTYNKTNICEGEQITFNDANTYNGTPTQWDWIFTGGTPNVSSLQSPVITYNTAGTYNVTYTPGNGAGWASASAVKSNLITVSSLIAQYTLPFSEGMENTTTFNNDWKIKTTSGIGWQNVTTAAYSGTHSLKVNNLTNVTNDLTEAISSSFNLTSVSNPMLDFKVAYTQKTTGGNDQLIIYSSINCGATWQIVTLYSATQLLSATATNTAFTPTGTSQWKSLSKVLSAGLASSTNVKFKFTFKSNLGNNIYIDDINISGSVGLNETKTVNNFIIYPNPTTESAIVSFNLNTDVKTLKITLKDVLGKEVTKIVNDQSFSAGKYTMSIDQGKKLASGLYFVEFNADNKIKIEKLIVK